MGRVFVFCFGEEDERASERERNHKKLLTGTTIDFHIRKSTVASTSKPVSLAILLEDENLEI